MDPITAAASGVGVFRAGVGFMEADERRNRNKRSIEAAYYNGRRDLTERQGDIRASQLERQNARGILQAGDATEAAARTPSIIERAFVAGGVIDQKAGPGLSRIIRPQVNAMGVEFDKNHAQANVGRVGPSNTLAGGEQSQLSTEFAEEGQDLWRAKNEALNANDAERGQDRIDAIAGGIGAGMTAYSLGQNMKVAGAYGIDPLDPVSSLTTGYGTTWHGGDPNFAFNVARARRGY